MTEQEFRKLKQLDLIQILLTQSSEVTAQQGDLDRKSERLELLLEENDIIKAKLNDRDAMTEMIKSKLNESDERIGELEKELKKLCADRRIELEETGSLVQAALELNKIFEAAQKEAEQYIQNREPGNKRLTFDETSVPTELKPEQSENKPGQSENKPGQSENKPEQSENKPEQSENEPEQPELVPKEPELIFSQQPEDIVNEECRHEEEASIKVPLEEERSAGQQEEVKLQAEEESAVKEDSMAEEESTAEEGTTAEEESTAEEGTTAEEESTVKEGSMAEEESTAEEGTTAEEKLTVKDEPTAEEEPAVKEEPAAEEKSTAKETSAAVGYPKPTKGSGRAKPKGLLRFFRKWKK